MIEGKKISKLDPIQNLQEACCFPVLSRGATRKITFAALLNNIIAKLPDARQEEIDEIKRTISRLEKQIEAVAIDNKEVEELLKDVTFTIDGQNATILEYTAKIREFEQEIGSSSIAESIQRINSFIPSTASETNKLVSKSYVDESIQTSTAVNRGSFETYADLVAYSGTVTRNDYAYVADDETHDHEAWRYKWNDNTHEWTAEYRINEAPMTLEQLAALNSGITAEKVSEIDGKQDALSSEQMEAVNSGITSEKITELEEKQDALSETQLEAVNSGITADLVSQIGTGSLKLGIVELSNTTWTNMINYIKSNFEDGYYVGNGDCQYRVQTGSSSYELRYNSPYRIYKKGTSVTVYMSSNVTSISQTLNYFRFYGIKYMEV